MNSGIFRFSLNMMAKFFIFNQHQGDVSFQMGSLRFRHIGVAAHSHFQPAEIARRILCRYRSTDSCCLQQALRIWMWDIKWYIFLHLSPKITELYLKNFEEKVLYIHSCFLLQHSSKLSKYSDYESERELTALLFHEAQGGVFGVSEANRSAYCLVWRGNLSILDN